MGITRREFGKKSLLAIIAAMFIPLISFGKQTTKAAKQWILKSLPGGIQLTHERDFEKLVDRQYRYILRPENMTTNSVHEVWTDQRTGEEFNGEQARELEWKHFGKPKRWWHRKYDFYRKAYLVQWMQIEVQYRDGIEYAKNKSAALQILATLFNESAKKKLIGYGCLMPCFSFPVADIDGHKREMICVWPVGLNDTDKYVSYLDNNNNKLGVEVFCAEGELARIFVRPDGTLASGKRDFSYPSAKTIMEKMASRQVEWIKS